MNGERRISLEQIANCRELGGMETADGYRIRRGMLLRSANLAQATEADLQKLCAEYRLNAVVDLRTSMEREQYPDVMTDRITVFHIPVFDEAVAGISHEKETDRLQVQAQMPAAPPSMTKLYRMIVSEETCRRNLGTAVRRIMEHSFETGSILWHCSEGKDRCGLVSALLLMALSVDREQIVEDYLITNEVNSAKAGFYYQKVLEEGQSEELASAVRDALVAKREYIEAAFAVIDGEYQTAERYIRDGLCIPDGTVRRFREQVLAG